MNSVSRGIEVAGGLGEVGGVHVGHEPERDVPRRVVPQRLVRHHRAEVRAADPDVQHVPDRLAGVALPLPGPDPVREVRHPVQDLVDLPHHVGAVHDQRRGPRHPQRHVQDGPVLGHVDVLAAEHGVPPFRHAGLGGQFDQQPHGLVGDPVLRVVQVEPGRLRAQPLASPRIRGEQLPQMLAGDLRVVPPQRLPCLPLRQRCQPSRHVPPPRVRPSPRHSFMPARRAPARLPLPLHCPPIRPGPPAPGRRKVPPPSVRPKSLIPNGPWFTPTRPGLAARASARSRPSARRRNRGHRPACRAACGRNPGTAAGAGASATAARRRCRGRC